MPLAEPKLAEHGLPCGAPNRLKPVLGEERLRVGQCRVRDPPRAAVGGGATLRRGVLLQIKRRVIAGAAMLHKIKHDAIGLDERAEIAR